LYDLRALSRGPALRFGPAFEGFAPCRAIFPLPDHHGGGGVAASPAGLACFAPRSGSLLTRRIDVGYCDLAGAACDAAGCGSVLALGATVRGPSPAHVVTFPSPCDRTFRLWREHSAALLEPPAHGPLRQAPPAWRAATPLAAPHGPSSFAVVGACGGLHLFRAWPLGAVEAPLQSWAAPRGEAFVDVRSDALAAFDAQRTGSLLLAATGTTLVLQRSV